MKRVLLTGMSGTGKSTMLRMLASDRIAVLELDDWMDESPMNSDRLIPVDRVKKFLQSHLDQHVVLAGCESNQRELYDMLDAVVLLTASPDTIRKRILERKENPFGKSAEEMEKILSDQQVVEPLLMKSCTFVLNTECPPGDVCREIIRKCGLE